MKEKIKNNEHLLVSVVLYLPFKHRLIGASSDFKKLLKVLNKPQCVQKQILQLILWIL